VLVPLFESVELHQGVPRRHGGACPSRKRLQALNDCLSRWDDAADFFLGPCDVLPLARENGESRGGGAISRVQGIRTKKGASDVIESGIQVVDNIAHYRSPLAVETKKRSLRRVEDILFGFRIELAGDAICCSFSELAQANIEDFEVVIRPI